MRLIKFYRKHTILVLTCLLVTMAVHQWGYYAGKEDAKKRLEHKTEKFECYCMDKVEMEK